MLDEKINVPSALGYTMYGVLLSKYVHTETQKAKEEYRTDLEDMLSKYQALDKRTLMLTMSIEKMEADVEYLKEKYKEEAPRKRLSFYLDDFEKINTNLQLLQDAGEDGAKTLYCIMEIEALLGRLEEKARVTNHKYEARLAASLRDICRVHEPSEITKELLKIFSASVRALIDGWSKLTREKVSWIRTKLLDVGLTWLPVTEKAEREIAEAKKTVEQG